MKPLLILLACLSLDFNTNPDLAPYDKPLLCYYDTGGPEILIKKKDALVYDFNRPAWVNESSVNTTSPKYWSEIPEPNRPKRLSCYDCTKEEMLEKIKEFDQ